MTSEHELRLIGIAWQLDHLRWASSDSLTEIVRSHGACMQLIPSEEPPWLDEPQSDRNLAAQLCAGCPVQEECLELELRTSGEHTVGVWGALTEDDRRAVHAHWLRRGERADDVDLEEGDPA